MEQERHSSTGRKGGKVAVEIRWFYDRKDIMGVSSSDTMMGVQELFETDHVDGIDAVENLLAPAKLHTDSKSIAPGESFMGAPIQNFICRRFWSTTRKSLIPCGSLEGRQKRGMLYSKSLPEDSKQKSTKSDALRAGPIPKLTWTESMASAIGKFTLKDASKGAYERGEALIGREKELQQLLSFFRAAIRGDPGTGGIKSSMFLAGAPGVGKVRYPRGRVYSIAILPAHPAHSSQHKSASFHRPLAFARRSRDFGLNRLEVKSLSSISYP
jgi:hypothetical protein